MDVLTRLKLKLSQAISKVLRHPRQPTLPYLAVAHFQGSILVKVLRHFRQPTLPLRLLAVAPFRGPILVKVLRHFHQ